MNKVKDGIVGRPLRLNRQTLQVKKGKNYAEVVFISDVHYGSPQCDVARFLKMIDYCYKNRLYVFLGGDLVEVATKSSPGAGVFEQTKNGQSQFEQMCEWLKPLADKKLILGTHSGNHSKRVYNLTGVDLGKAFARELNVRYLGDACWSRFKVGKQIYSIYSLHGRSGARFDGTALLAIERLSASFFCDLMVISHMHKIITSCVIMQRIHNNRVVEHKKYLLVTGSFLSYDGSYAQAFGLPISKLGSPKVKLFSDKKDVHISS